MSDTTTSTEPVKKPLWTRCKGPEGKGNGCRQRVFNTPLDIEYHRQHCPADLERVVARLEDRIEKLEKTEIVLPEQVNLDDVADEWPTSDDDAIDDEEDLDDDEPEPALRPAAYDPVTGQYR